MRKNAKPIAAIILALLGVILVLQNTAPVETQLVFATVTMPRAVLLLITLLIGFTSGVLASLVWSKRSKAAEKARK
jgi:uncharacterized integral membrane protein